ncbi:MAG TPA: exonuclease domain-containing protein [Polyangiaceae bacterium]|nr:exonuclease domain-containing protein [Polyangiaceae bacterium]
MSRAEVPEIYVATDVEADGPIPGPYSMLSVGMAVVDHAERTHYTEIKPISDRFVPEALAVSGLDRERLKREAPDAATAMKGLAQWVDSLSDLGKPVFLAAPAVFDGMFLHWYFIEFVGRDPFAVNGAGIDLRSYWMGARSSRWGNTGRSAIVKDLGIATPPHTHHALDDARELAAIFAAVLRTRVEGNR